MPGASDHECPDKGSPASKTSCTSEVLKQLESLATNARPSQKLRFPDRLVEALLRIEPSVNTRDLDAIRLIIEPNWKKTLQSLNNDSLRCLSYVLLCSSAPAEQESGLYLLLDGNQHPWSSKPEGSGPKLLRSRSKSLSLQNRLISILHTFFINDGNDIEHRRLAGKLLLELLLESKDHLSSEVFHIQELINDASGVLCSETDIILRFFAGAIIRILRLSGVANSFGAPEDVTHGSTRLEGLGKFSKDWNGYFHLYTLETESQHTGAMGKATQPKVDLMNSYHTIQELRICGREHIREAILTAMTPDALIFIFPLGTGPEQFQYIEIPLWCISKRKTPALKKAENKKSQLRLHLDMESHVLINGRAHPSNGSDVYITSDSDLTALWKTLDTGRKIGLQKSKNKRLPRGKISSIVVTLCTGDEISMKSIQYCEEIRQGEGRSSENSSFSVPGTIEDINENTETVIESKKVDNEPGLTCEKPADDGALAKGSQRDEVIQGSEEALEQLSVSKGASELPCNSRESKRNSPQKDSPYASNACISAEKARNDAPVSDATNLASVIQMQHSSLSDTAGENDKAGAKSEKGPLPQRNVDSVQRKSSGNRPRKTKSSTERKGRTRFLDTQESLIFPRSRRPKRKVYTVHSKPAVDWDEHLRPSDQGDDMLAAKDPEVTSVSSPSPGESSIFDKSSKNTTRKRKAKGCQSAEKGKKPIKKKKTNCDPRSEEAARSPLVSTGTNARNRRNKVSVSDTKDDNENDLSMTHGDTHESDRDYEMDDAELSLEYAPHLVLLNDDSASVLKEDNSPFLRETQCDFPNSGSEEENHTSDGHRKTKRLKGDTESDWDVEDQLKTDTKTQAQEDAKAGRGQTVGEKLAAALCEGNIRPDTQTVHGHNGDDPPLVCEMSQEKIPRLTSSIEDGTCFAGNKCGDKLVEKDGDHNTPRTRLDLKENVEFPAIPETTVCAVNRDLTHEKTAPKSPDEKSKNDAQATEFERLSTKNKSRTTSPDSIGEPGEIQTMSTAPVTQSQSQSNIIARPRLSSDASHRSAKSHKAIDMGKANDKSSILGLSNKEKAYLALDPENPLVEYDREKPDSEKITAICLSKGSQDESASISGSSQSSPKRTLVDENGSPRRISRKYIQYQSSSELETELRQPAQLDKSLPRDVIEQGGSESGYDGDSDGNDTDESPMIKDVVSTFRRKIVSQFGEESLGSLNTRISLTGNQDMPHYAFSKMKRPPCFVDRLRAPEIPNIPQATARELGANIGDNDPKSPTTVPSQFPSMEYQDPVQLDHGMKEMSKPVREKHYQGKWHSSLHMIQKSAQDIMNQTNEHLMRHAEDEKNTVSRVLENYREGCHRVLDQLFEAQEQRIELYRQQMITVKQHHAGLCRDLIRRLEENDKRIQEKVLHMENSMLSLVGGNEPQSAEELLGSYRRKTYTTANGNFHISHSPSDGFDESSSTSG